MLYKAGRVTWFESDTESEAVQIHQAVTVGTEESVMIGYQNSSKYIMTFWGGQGDHDTEAKKTLPLYEKVNSIV